MRQIILLLMLTITSAVFAYEPLITEDKVWEYYLSGQDGWSRSGADILYKIKFDGTEDYNGVTYHKLKIISYSSWGWELHENSDGSIEEEYTSHADNQPLDKLYGLLREGNQKVYLLYDGDGYYGYDKNTDRYEYIKLETPKEFLLYDFSLKKDDTYSSLVSSPEAQVLFEMGMYESEVKCLEIKEGLHFRDNNIQMILRPMNLYNDANKYGGVAPNEYKIEVMEGAGNIGLGDLVNIGYESGVRPLDNSYSEHGFNNLYDLDGNVIYPGKGISNPLAEVKDVSAESPRHDGKMYDLNGREIRNPLPGTVYIRDGRKAVAR